MISIRAEEMRFVQSSAYTRAWNSTLMQTGPLLMSLLAFITLGLTTDNLEAQYIFSSLTLFNLLRMPLMLLPMTIAFGSDAKIGIQRIQAFLLADELHSEPEYVDTDKFAVKVSDANFEWEKAVAEGRRVHEGRGRRRDQCQGCCARPRHRRGKGTGGRSRGRRVPP